MWFSVQSENWVSTLYRVLYIDFSMYLGMFFIYLLNYLNSMVCKGLKGHQGV